MKKRDRKDGMSTGRRTQAREADSGIREQILAAALDGLREAGIQKLSQVQVARRANVRQSHLTYYFPKRLDLVEAVAVRFIDGLVGAVEAMAAASAGSGPDAVLRRLSAMVTEPGHMRMFAGLIVEADGDAGYRAVMVREMRRVQSAVAGALGGEDASERALAVVAALWGFGLYRFLTREPANAEREAALVACLAGVARTQE